MLLETAARRGEGGAQPALSKRFLSSFFFTFESGGMKKHFMSGPTEDSEFCFPETLNVSLGEPRGTLRVSGKHNSLFPLRPA